MAKKLTLQHATDLAEFRGGKCLSTEYINARTHMLWECKFGHTWRAVFDSVARGSWCPECKGKIISNKKRKYSIKDAKELALKRGGLCLSKKYYSTKKKLLWKCSCENVWEATYEKVLSGTWCKKCGNVSSAKKRSGSLGVCVDIAKARGGRCISSFYKNGKTKIKWQCERGHVWLASYNNVYSGKWCPTCATEKNGSSQRLNIESCRVLAKKNKGFCLSKSYVNAKTKIKWKCETGHVWESNYNNVYSGKWCPICSSNKTQKKLNKILKSVLNQESEFNYRPDWLKNPETNYNLEVDMYFPNLKLAVEYNGKQHYEPVNFSGKMTEEELEKNLENTKKRDKLKRKLAKKSKHVDKFITFTYKDEITEDSVRKKLIKRGVIDV